MNIGEFAARVGANPHTIRYYEKLGLLGRVRRLPNGHRFFSERDVEWIAFVQRLKDTGMPLEGILRYAQLRAQGDSTLLTRQRLLEEHSIALKREIAKQQLHLKKLDEKIAFYRTAVKKAKRA